ncbi:MAG: hypothetical protein KGI54_14320 [Pseudomonadota bacterium]|nr:hypothetical protein [Pseudomonadota bacterium]
MSIFSTIFSLGKTALGFLNPAGSALKLAPWGIAAALGVALYVEHARLIAADANIKVAQGQTTTAVKQCQTEVAAQAAKDSAAAVAQIQKANAAANAAETQLAAERTAASVIAAQAAQGLGRQLGTITAQASQSGQDGAVYPVIGNLYP